MWVAAVAQEAALSGVRVPCGMVGKAPPAPLLLPQGLMVAEYLQQEYGDGVVLRKW